MYEKERPKRNTKNKAILGQKLALALEFLPKAQKLDRPTPTSPFRDLCRKKSGIVVCLY